MLIVRSHPPEPPRCILRDGEECLGLQAPAKNGKFAVPQLADPSSFRADPYCAVVTFIYAFHVILRKSVGFGVSGNLPLLEPDEATTSRSKPNTAVPVLIQRLNVVAGKSVLRSVRDQLAAFEPSQTATHGTEPQVSVVISEYGPNILIKQALFEAPGPKPSLLEPF